jgi:DNA-binding MarR family transcriptional regulator
LSADEVAVLSALSDAHDAPLFELSSRTKIAPSKVAAVVDRLMEYDLAVRSDDKITLTKGGAAALRTIRQGPLIGQIVGFGKLPDKGSSEQIMSTEEIDRILDEEVKKLEQ